MLMLGYFEIVALPQNATVANAYLEYTAYQKTALVATASLNI